MKYLSLIFLALATIAAGAVPHTTTTTPAMDAAESLYTDARADIVEPGVKPLAGIPGSASVSDGMQSIHGAGRDAGRNLVTTFAIISGESGTPGNAEMQSDKAVAVNAALFMGMQVPAIVAVVGVPGVQAPAPMLDTGLIRVQLRPPQVLVDAPERQGTTHPGQLARVDGRGRWGDPQRLVRRPG